MSIRGGDVVAHLVVTWAGIHIIWSCDRQIAFIELRLLAKDLFPSVLIGYRKGVELVFRDAGELQGNFLRKLLELVALLYGSAHDGIVRQCYGCGSARDKRGSSHCHCRAAQPRYAMAHFQLLQF